MGKAMQDIYFAILSEASRRRRLTEYKINNPTGLIDGCSPYGAKAGKTVDDLDHPDARTIDETTTAEPFRTKSRLCRACGNPVPHTADGATCCYDCEQDLRARAAAAHRSPRTRRVALIEHFPAEHKNTSTDHNDAKCPSPLAYPTTSDINALVTWALRNDLVRDNQSDRLAKQLLGAYRASHTFRQTPDGAPSHIKFVPTNKTDAQVELIAHVINVAARETDYLVGCLADGVLTKIMIVVTGGSLPGD